jgi:hypothetical protein
VSEPLDHAPLGRHGFTAAPYEMDLDRIDAALERIEQLLVQLQANVEWFEAHQGELIDAPAVGLN